MKKVRYTDEQIGSAFERYRARIDAVMDTLRTAPLNEYGVHEIVHASKIFLL